MTPFLCFLQLTLISNNLGVWRLESKTSGPSASPARAGKLRTSERPVTSGEPSKAKVAAWQRRSVNANVLRKAGVRKWEWVLKKSRNSAIRNESDRLFSAVCIEF